MRKSRKEAAETRQRIVQAASQEFRRNGIEGTGLSELMAAAGLTHGGFYNHFDSKEQVVEESITFGIDSMTESWRKTLLAEGSKKGLPKVITEYLSPALREDVADGCPFAALASDMARSSEPVRQATTAGFSRMIDLIASELPHLSPAAAKKEALWMFSSMVGAVVMSRVVTDPALSDSILRETRKHVLAAS